jgi:hypothetical protein
MPLPAAVQTCTVTFGTALSMFGKDVAMRVTVTPTHDLLWAATGQPILAFTETFTVPAGVEGSFVVPVVDQAGWKNSAGQNFTGWAYDIEIQYTGGGGTRTVKKPIQVFTGQTQIDLDVIPGGSIVPAVTAPAALVTSVNGQTGAVTVVGGGGGGGTPDDNTVTTAKIASKAVTTAKIADAAVSTLQIADGSVTNAEIANDAINAAKISAADAAAIRTKLNVQAAGSYLNASEAQAITDASINALIGAAPAALNTLDELAAALGDDANFQSTVLGLIAAKASQTDLDAKVPTSRQVAGVSLTSDITGVQLVNALNALGFDITYTVRINATTHVWPTIAVPAGFTGRVVLNSDTDPSAPTPPSGPDGYYWQKYNA